MYVVSLVGAPAVLKIEPKAANQLNPDEAAEGMARMAEIPANKRKCLRYIRKVSSSRSPISSGRSLRGTDTLTAPAPIPVAMGPAKRCTKEGMGRESTCGSGAR